MSSPNYNPFGLHIGNKVVSILLARCGNRGELRLARNSVDCHDLKIQKGTKVVFNLNHTYSMADNGGSVKGFFHAIKDSQKSVIVNDLCRAAGARLPSP